MRSVGWKTNKMKSHAISKAQKVLKVFPHVPMKSSENTQRVPFMLDKSGESTFSQTGEMEFLLWETAHSAENPKQSSMLAKRFVSSKNQWSFDKKIGKNRIVPKK